MSRNDRRSGAFNASSIDQLTVKTANLNGQGPPDRPSLSPSRVMGVVAHAEQIRSCVDGFGPIFAFFAQETFKITEMSSVAAGYDQLDVIKGKEETDSIARKGLLEEKKAYIAKNKEESIARHTTALKVMIRQYVEEEVTKRITNEITKFIALFQELVDGNENLRMHNQAILDNIRARSLNAAIIPRLRGELIREMTPPMSMSIPELLSSVKKRSNPTTVPSRFPANLESLMRLDLPASKCMVKEYRLTESVKPGEKGRLENINRLMSHLGIVRYHLNQISPHILITRVV